MTTEEHLKRIRARCVELLALAQAANITNVETMAHHVSINIGDWTPVKTPEIATFIASCSGPAEAGWKATIAAIDGLQSIGWYESDGEIHSDNSHNGRTAHAALEPILAAWPEELL